MEMGTGARVATLGAVTMEMVGKAALEVAMEMVGKVALEVAMEMEMGARVATLEVAMEMEMGARVATLEEEVTVLGEAAMAMVAKVGLMEATTGIVSEVTVLGEA